MRFTYIWTRRGRRPRRGGAEGAASRQAGDYKGRFLVRVPASIHQELVERAAREHTTLNQLVLSYISRGLGGHPGSDA